MWEICRRAVALLPSGGNPVSKPLSPAESVTVFQTSPMFKGYIYAQPSLLPSPQGESNAADGVVHKGKYGMVLTACMYVCTCARARGGMRARACVHSTINNITLHSIAAAKCIQKRRQTDFQFQAATSISCLSSDYRRAYAGVLHMGVEEEKSN